MDCVLKAAMNNNKEERKEMKSGKILAILGMGAIISIGTCVTPVLAGEEDAQTYTFTLEGDTFTLPIKVEDFLAKGWEPNLSSDGFDHDMSGISVMDKILVKNGKCVYVTVINYSENAAPAMDCYIGKVTVNTMTDGIAEFKTEAGIRLGSPLDEVEAVYGEPVNESDTEIMYSFSELKKKEEKEKMYNEAEETNSLVDSAEADYAVHGRIGDDHMTYGIDENGSIDEIELMNYTLPEEVLLQMLEDTETESTQEAADTEDSPETNTGEGTSEAVIDDIFNGKIEIMGKAYQFPASVSELEKNGWSFEYEGDVPGKRRNESVIAYVDNVEVGYVQVSNELDKAAPVSQCVLTGIDSENLELVLPGSIKEGTTMTELEAAVPELQDLENTGFVQKDAVSIVMDENSVDFFNKETNYLLTLALKEISDEKCVDSIRIWMQ